MKLPLDKIIPPALAAVCAIAAGCGDSDDWSADSGIFDLEKGLAAGTVAAETNALKTIDALAPEDVIVRVNAHSLTKRTYERMMAARAGEMLKEKDASPLVVEKQMDEHRRAYVKIWVGQRLLTDYAFAKGIVATNEVLEAVTDAVKSAARKVKKTSEKYLADMGGTADLWLYETAVAYAMNRVVKKEIPPKAEVDEEFVAAVHAQVEAENARATATNGYFKAKLAECRTRILGGKTTAEAAMELAKELQYPVEGGEWGEWEAGDLPSPEIEAEVWKLEKGEVSKVLEDENGYSVVMATAIAPEEKEGGRVVQREKRTLERVYLEKLPLLLRQSDIVMSRDLKRQMQMQAINEFTGVLGTNGANRIEYPHGTQLFK